MAERGNDPTGRDPTGRERGAGFVPEAGDATEAAPPGALHASLRRTRLTVLALLAVCALLSLLRSNVPSTLAPYWEERALYAALVVAGGILVARQLAVHTRDLRTRVRAIVAAWLLGGLLGVLGAGIALVGGDGRRGALYALAGAIFTVGSSVRSGAPQRLVRRPGETRPPRPRG